MSCTATKAVLISMTLLLAVGCSRPVVRPEAAPAAIPDVSVERSILAGDWDYEDGAVIALRLDREGNGNYAWKDGRFETTDLAGRIWLGRWIQNGNDREGEFRVELSDDFSEGEGSWWYTRIGDDRAPAEKGGTFRLTRKTEGIADNGTLTPP